MRPHLRHGSQKTVCFEAAFVPPRSIDKGKSPMIKDVMVRLDGTAADEARLAAAEYISGVFDGHIIGIFLNILPLIMPTEGDTVAAAESAKAVQRAREA